MVREEILKVILSDLRVPHITSLLDLLTSLTSQFERVLFILPATLRPPPRPFNTSRRNIFS